LRENFREPEFQGHPELPGAPGKNMGGRSGERLKPVTGGEKWLKQLFLRLGANDCGDNTGSWKNRACKKTV